MRTRRVGSRIFANDFQLWAQAGSQTVLGEHCFDWTRSIAETRADSPELQPGENSILILVGMGGATLSASAYECVCREHLERALVLLDSTSPDSIAGLLLGPPRTDCHYLIASKSGETLETLSIAETLFTHVKRPDLFTVITDSRSSTLGKWAVLQGIDIEYSDAYVPGRFSGLARLALIPGARLGVDVASLQNVRHDFARSMADDDERAIKVQTLAAKLADACLITGSELIIDAPLKLLPVARWIEQLVAESLGKSGMGVLPVILYGQSSRQDGEIRTQVAIRGQKTQDCYLTQLEDETTLAEMFLFWQSAVSMAAYLIGIDPYSQPEVERAKRTDLFSKSLEKKPIDDEDAFFQHVVETDSDYVYESTAGLVNHFEESLNSGDYIAIFAYVNPISYNETVLEAFAKELEIHFSHRKIRVVYNFGPQYLHSTGQFHKSIAIGRSTDPTVAEQSEKSTLPVASNRANAQRAGHYLFIESETVHDFPVSGRSYSFSWLIKHQAYLDAAYLSSIAQSGNVVPGLIRCSADVVLSLAKVLVALKKMREAKNSD